MYQYVIAPSSGFRAHQKVGSPGLGAPRGCLHCAVELPSMKTHKAAPSNSQPFRRDSCESMVTAVTPEWEQPQGVNSGVKSNVGKVLPSATHAQQVAGETCGACVVGSVYWLGAFSHFCSHPKCEKIRCKPQSMKATTINVSGVRLGSSETAWGRGVTYFTALFTA